MTAGPTRVLAVLPSTALGGGIERYSETVLKALQTSGVNVERVAFNVGTGTGRIRRLRFLSQLYRAGRDSVEREPITVLIFHPALASAAEAVLRIARTHRAKTTIFFYGQDIWALSRLDRQLIQRAHARLVTISAFSAGALAPLGSPRLLPPGLDRVWYELLLSTRKPRRGTDPPWRLLSVFRLDAAEVKGAYVLLEVGDQLIAQGLAVNLRMAGSGAASQRLRREIAKRNDWAQLVEAPSDGELARLYAWADLFVLATRTSPAQPSSMEGFGIVLAEAQVAGLPVVAPALGGASSAYVDGMTGVAPIDESIGALTAVLQRLLSKPETLHRMAENAAAWARQRFDPADYVDRVIDVLLDEPTLACFPQPVSPYPVVSLGFDYSTKPGPGT